IDDDDNLTVTFSAPPSTDSYRVVVLASGGESSGGGNGTNLALGKPYTLSPAPSASYPDTPPGSFLLAGDSDYADSEGRLTDGFVPPPGGAGTGAIPAKVSVGWQTANDIVIRLDLGSA